MYTYAVHGLRVNLAVDAAVDVVPRHATAAMAVVTVLTAFGAVKWPARQHREILTQTRDPERCARSCNCEFALGNTEGGSNS